MAANPSYRLPSAAIESDRAALLALKGMSDFTPVNRGHSAEALQALQQAMELAEEAEVRAQQALATARDIAISAAWDFHKAVLGAKAQVIAQYGNDSLAVQAIGLKKTSDRKRPARRRAA